MSGLIMYHLRVIGSFTQIRADKASDYNLSLLFFLNVQYL